MHTSSIQTLWAGYLSLVIFLILSGCAGPPVAERPYGSASLADGVYEGSAMGWPNRAVVKVTISDHKIVDINVVEHWELQGEKAESVVIQRIIEQQTPHVDAVSGATNSSWVLMNAVEDALEKARRDKKTSADK
ncbi:MAG: FMN-binding protein [Deltaproteobacteria bacterium]|nr:FMN-binding protein [Deltaproteobacteria bacterium]